MHLRQLPSLAVMLATLGSFVVFPGSMNAEDIQFVSMTAFADMQQRLEEVEFQLSSIATIGGSQVGDGGYDVKSGKSGKGRACGTCTSPGVTLDLQLLFLRPFGSDNGDFDTNNQYNAGTRLTAGYVHDNGVGAQIRWFAYGIDTIDDDGHFDTFYLDLEVTDKFQFGCWDGTLSGGVRYDKFNQPGNTDGLEGWGPVLGLSMSRHVVGNLYFVGSGHYSMLFGNETFDDEDDTWNMAELQLAAEYRRDGWGGMQCFARVGLDANYWSAISDDDDEDLGLVGVALAFGITR